MNRHLFALAALAVLPLGAAPLREPAAPILVPVANDPTVSFRLWFKVGAQNDPAGQAGLAALTAAMLTEAATQWHRYDEILDKLFPLASGYSATPSMEMTVITGRTHVDNLADFYPLLRDAVLAPAFKQEDLDRLRSRTLNFIENQLRFADDEELGKAVLYGEIFAGTPYGHLGAGTVASLKRITLDDVKAFYAAHYTRDNVVIGLGGGYQPALLEQLRADLAQLPAGSPPRVPAPQPPPLSGLSVTLVEKKNASTALSVGFPLTVVRGSREWYALAIANSWLGEHRNQSGRLFQVIREKRGLNYGDYSYIEHYPNGGLRMTPPQNVARRRQLFELWIRPVPHEARHFALRAALREVDQLIKNGLTAAQFEERRAFLKKYVLHYAATTSERLGYAIDDAFYGLDEPHLEKYRRLMDDLTLAEVNAAIKKHWSLADLKIVAVTQDAAAFAAALVADAPSPITYATPKPAAIMEEDQAIAIFPLKIKREAVKIVPVAELFEP
ncbi:MAG: pitrilysin family protein [Opitutaceae bacterium]|nr:pitrilysin family protein [Opitutaceae bacterium]